MLSRYNDFTRLGQGGMGVVYRATDTQLRRPVALKFVTARFGSEDQARARFLREARMSAALNHPAICTIYEIGEVQSGEERLVATEAPLEPGTPFIAMELIQGKSLDEVLRARGRLRSDELLDIAIPIADALAGAHAKGIVHRDLKPANVMISPEGRPKILDFGLAKVVDAFGDEAVTTTETQTESAELTRRGRVLGTIAYMSPEQAQGKPVDLRSDIFSFGVMLYEMAAGERPFRGDTPTSTLAKILETEPKPLGDIRSDLPGELLRIVRRCLRKKPDERFQGTGDLVVALKELRQETASGPSKGWSDAVPATPRRYRKGLAVAASAVVLITAAIAGGAWLSRRHPALKPELVHKQITSNLSENALLGSAISPDGKYLAFADPTGTYVRVIETGETHRIVAHETLSVTHVNWFPDGTRLVVAALNPTIAGVSSWELSILGGTPRKLRDNALGCSVSPDGSQILFADMAGVSFNGMWVMGPDGENARQVLPKVEGNGEYRSWSWSLDSKRFLFVRVGGSNDVPRATLGVSDLTESPPTVILSDPRLVSASSGANCWWLPDGTILYTLTEPPPNQASSNLWQLRFNPKTKAADGEPRRLTNWADSELMRLNASRDGKRLAFLKERSQTDVYLGELQAEGSRLDNVQRFTLDARDDHPSGWTRDSRALYFDSDRQGTFDVFRQGVEDRTAEVVVQGPDDEAQAKLSPDGAFLLYEASPRELESTAVRLMRAPVAGGAPEVILKGKNIAGFDCPALPVASCVLIEFQDGKMTYSRLDPLKGKGREIGQVETTDPTWSLSPDGSRIAFIVGGVSTGGAENSRIRSINVSDGAIEDLHVEGLALPFRLAWSSDGRSLFIMDFVVKTSPTLRLIHSDLAGHGRVLREWNSKWDTDRNPLPSGDGRYLAYEQQSVESNAWMLENF